MENKKIIEGEVIEEKKENKEELQKQRADKLQAEVTKLQQKYGFSMYAVNAVMPNGDIMPVIKLKDLLEE